ncbi:hypothetical protein OG978_14850 [Streptomyces sp. NBC_01591]|uniref:hypothetical protein n=1 Tax=Streptomyces sp. NBC_01591 TaxID=2975888 RepID=UPI002DD8C09C|nr:hypothetical protein [Streptomyces sp. NBC_01591]WSD68571.1 hypothetical protein OG978_14850 [Streptomyces sp. NBC_01591]
MQTTEASAFRANEFMNDVADEHPAGRIALGAGGRLGLRSRILSAADSNTGCTSDLPWTTMTWV